MKVLSLLEGFAAALRDARQYAGSYPRVSSAAADYTLGYCRIPPGDFTLGCIDI
jgi:hypothetical protein